VAFAFAAVVTLWGNRHALAPKIHAAIDWLAAVLA
jgi:hypothetical protein